MKIPIIINIEAGAKACEPCEWWDRGECDLFEGPLGLEPMCGFRAPECLAAESRLSALTEAVTLLRNECFYGAGERRVSLVYRVDRALAAIKEDT